MDQSRTPLFQAIVNHVKQNPISFHVPGHKNGQVFMNDRIDAYSNILKYDLTELVGLDDLHQPEGAIQEAEALAASFYRVKRTFFLVNGSTSGNLAMILSVCKPGDQILVQRNSHKSIMHALELSGARPIFFSPQYDEETSRFSKINVENIKKAIVQYPNIKAIVLTYPDYFGSTYDLTSIVDYAHQFNIPVLVDEAHGAHFVLGDPFPKSATLCGADLIVHSAHKTLPAMTMGSYLHFQSKLIDEKTVQYFLQIVQSSSPSYPIMASLDLARKYLYEYSDEKKQLLLERINELREHFSSTSLWEVQKVREKIDDPIKMTLLSNQYDMTEVDKWFNSHGIYSEMVENNQLLLVGGLEINEQTIDRVKSLVKTSYNHSFPLIHGKMTNELNVMSELYELPFDYHQLHRYKVKTVKWKDAIGRIAASSVIPYPPGIPLILKGEEITREQVDFIKAALRNKRYIQYQGKDLNYGIEVFDQEKE